MHEVTVAVCTEIVKCNMHMTISFKEACSPTDVSRLKKKAKNDLIRCIFDYFLSKQ